MEIETTLTRGVEQVLPNREGLAKLMREKKITLYQGFDPTTRKLHIGHMVAFRKLAQFQQLGHKVIFLIGDGTGQAGDPSGKLKTREKFLTKTELRKNAEGYREQASHFLRFDGDNPVQILYNSEWLNKLGLIDILGIAQNFSVQQLLERDMFQRRIKNDESINLREFIYPLLQGYDSVAMDVDLEIGGNDQLFNMMAGRTLMKVMKHKEKYVLTTKLLTDPAGKKMGKTEGNTINLTDKPEEIYGKVMAMPDEITALAVELLTDLPVGSLKNIDSMAAKKRLAFEVVRQIHDTDEAERSEMNFEATFQNKKLPKNIEAIRVERETMAVLDLLFETKTVDSRSEAKRLIKAGAVDVDGKTLDDPQREVAITKKGIILKIGKKKFLKVIKK